MRKKIGLICIDYGENRAYWEDLIAQLEPEVEVSLTGIMDGLTREEVEREFAFASGENYLIMEMPWNPNFQMSEATAQKYMLRRAEEHFQNGADTVMVLCTGDFERPASPRGLFLLPEDLMHGVMTGLQQKKLGILVPEEDQIVWSMRQYAALNPVFRAASPFGSMEQLAAAAASFREEDVEVIVLDCMGYTVEMARIVAQESGKQVLVPRLILPKLLKSLLVQV